MGNVLNASNHKTRNINQSKISDIDDCCHMSYCATQLHNLGMFSFSQTANYVLFSRSSRLLFSLKNIEKAFVSIVVNSYAFVSTFINCKLYLVWIWLSINDMQQIWAFRIWTVWYYDSDKQQIQKGIMIHCRL